MFEKSKLNKKDFYKKSNEAINNKTTNKNSFEVKPDERENILKHIETMKNANGNEFFHNNDIKKAFDNFSNSSQIETPSSKLNKFYDVINSLDVVILSNPKTANVNSNQTAYISVKQVNEVLFSLTEHINEFTANEQMAVISDEYKKLNKFINSTLNNETMPVTRGYPERPTPDILRQ